MAWVPVRLLACFSALRSSVENRKQLLTRWALPAALVLLSGGLAGCGSGSTVGTGGGGGGGGSTAVTLMVSSAANDALSRFSLFLNTLTLTSQSGKTVNLLTTPQQVEFTHLNGNPEPLLNLSVPQDVYTSATATVGAASFTCLVQNNGSDTTDTYAYGYTPDDQVTVNLPATVRVQGGAMALQLELEVSQSASFPTTCTSIGIWPYTITPTFDLTEMQLAAQPTNSTNGRLTAVEGLVSAAGAGGNSFTLTAPDGTNAFEISTSGQVVNSANWNWPVSTNSNTVFQGVGNAAGLAVGMPVDMDGALQSDGSVLATRVAVLDTNTTELTVNTGPLMFVSDAVPSLYDANRQFEGSEQLMDGWLAYDFSNTAFAVWGGLTNTATLPFGAAFDSSNMVAGQMVSLTTHVTQPGEGTSSYVPAATMTLMPQTIDATVNGVTAQGNFTVYTVTLAPYDTFPQFAVQGGQTTLLGNPQQVIVYADSNTQMLNSSAVTAGSVVRLTGVVFNDGGTLRMDCTQLLDGVAE